MKWVTGTRELIRGVAARARQTLGAGLARTDLAWWATLHDGQRLKVDLANTVGRSIALRKRYEPRLERLMTDLLPPGGGFVDIGANVGYFALVAARRVGPTGRVIAVEPNPRLAAFIAQSAAANARPQLIVRATALGAAAGTASLQVQRSSGISFIGDRAHVRDDDTIVRAVTVPVETLDRLLAHLAMPAPQVVKIDVEGRELDVLRGAATLIAAGRTAFIVEICAQNLARYGVHAVEIGRLMGDAGYQVFDLEGRALEPGVIASMNAGDVLFMAARSAPSKAAATTSGA